MGVELGEARSFYPTAMTDEQKPDEQNLLKATTSEPTTTIWNQKLAEIVTQSVMSGGLGLGTFFTLLGSSDLPKLALAGVIGGAAPIGYALGAPMVKKIKKGAGMIGDGAAGLYRSVVSLSGSI